jgi:hypothetical protein
MKTKTKAGRRALYELMAKKVGDDSFGNTELLATISLDELKTVERIAKALANDNSGRLLTILKTHMDSLEPPPAKAISREVLLRAREMAARASKAKHPRGCKAQQPDDPERLVEIQKLYERGRALVKDIGADHKTAGESRPK